MYLFFSLFRELNYLKMFLFNGVSLLRYRWWRCSRDIYNIFSRIKYIYAFIHTWFLCRITWFIYSREYSINILILSLAVSFFSWLGTIPNTYMKRYVFMRVDRLYRRVFRFDKSPPTLSLIKKYARTKFIQTQREIKTYMYILLSCSFLF